MTAKTGEMFQFYIEKSKFKLPMTNVPVIMISIGAGLAPFVAFIDEGNSMIETGKVSKNDFGEWWLFFGCRYKNGDYIYKNKLENVYNDKNGVLNELKVAFSREQKQKVYVQDLIEKNKDRLWKLINETNAKIYVCGGVAMGRAVRETFVKIFEFYNKEKKGSEYLDHMIKRDNYIQELWG
eukprot:61191_1